MNKFDDIYNVNSVHNINAFIAIMLVALLASNHFFIAFNNLLALLVAAVNLPVGPHDQRGRGLRELMAVRTDLPLSLFRCPFGSYVQDLRILIRFFAEVMEVSPILTLFLQVLDVSFANVAFHEIISQLLALDIEIGNEDLRYKNSLECLKLIYRLQ